MERQSKGFGKIAKGDFYWVPETGWDRGRRNFERAFKVKYSGDDFDERMKREGRFYLTKKEAENEARRIISQRDLQRERIQI